MRAACCCGHHNGAWRARGLNPGLCNVAGAQVKQLRRRKVVHVPSLAVGGLLGWLAAKHLAGLVSQLRQRLAQPPSQQQQQAQHTPPAG